MLPEPAARAPTRTPRQARETHRRDPPRLANLADEDGARRTGLHLLRPRAREVQAHPGLSVAVVRSRQRVGGPDPSYRHQTLALGRFAEQELECPDLVAADRRRRQVVALDPQTWPWPCSALDPEWETGSALYAGRARARGNRSTSGSGTMDGRCLARVLRGAPSRRASCRLRQLGEPRREKTARCHPPRTCRSTSTRRSRSRASWRRSPTRRSWRSIPKGRASTASSIGSISSSSRRATRRR